MNPVSNSYIVVLNDDVVSHGASLNVRRSQVRAVAENLAQLYGGRPGFIYDYRAQWIFNQATK